MRKDDLAKLLASALPPALAEQLVEQFLQLRQDHSTKTLGRSSPGKFVEAFVQALQQLSTGSYEEKPDVDGFLRKVESSGLDEGLRVCAARVARGMYALRSKRNITHLGTVDPNVYGLKYLFHAAQWVLAELIRVACRMSIADAARAIELVEAPIEDVIEDFGTHRLVLAEVTVEQEILLQLKSYYPDGLRVSSIEQALSRSKPGTVRAALRTLWRQKDVEGGGKGGYRLTQKGFRNATIVASSLPLRHQE